MTDQPNKQRKKKPQRKANKPVSKQERVSLFIDAYVETRNISEAARRAGYADRSAGQQGHRLMKEDEVRKEIDRRINAVAEEAEITRERVLKEYARIAFFDVRKFYNPDGTLKQVTELDDDTAAALAGMDVMQLMGDGESGIQTKKIKLADKRAALDSIVKFMGWAEQKVVLKGDAENPLQMLITQVSGTALKPVLDDGTDD